MCILQMCNQKVLTDLDPVRVFSGADPSTGEPIPEDWASPGAQFRAGWEGHVRQVVGRLQILHPHTHTRLAFAYKPHIRMRIHASHLVHQVRSSEIK